MDKQFTVIRNGNVSILYDAGLLADDFRERLPALFENHVADAPAADASASDVPASDVPTRAPAGIGRARVRYLQCAELRCVLKHYHRGGMVASLLGDRYLGRKPQTSRAFREYRLLKKLQRLGLPVPQAVAARVEQGLLFQRADLITRQIEHSRTLADALETAALPAAQWQALGRCLKNFHRYQVYHADLNARNILLDDNNHFYLIDFDNSDIREGEGRWKAANLSRLHRSLMKFKRNRPVFYFSEDDWGELLAGYGG